MSLLLQPGTISKFTEEEKKFLDRADASTATLNKLIENLLTVSKIEQGKMKLTFKNINLSEIIINSIDEFSKLAQAKGLNLRFEKPDTEIPEISADSLRIGEVVTNLVNNAIAYTQQGEIVVRIKANSDSVTTSVSDTGQGIPEDALPHLFTKFFRVQGVLEAGSKGTGLGLNISKNIVEAHQGRIWVVSKLGKGSTFFFSLPITIK
jgi:two-component system, OmpR family, phosphate regulon sensor histidine kinase PhoR